jgi:prepilin-type N-terminal cleavage/methylation domain-containing protein/prepilin-type processing-associated H-X9-DG protein
VPPYPESLPGSRLPRPALKQEHDPKAPLKLLRSKSRWPDRGVNLPPLCQHRSGLSLVELLVVIAIIVILAALSFQAVGAMRARSDSAKCMSNLRAMGVAIHLYASDHDGRYPGPVWYSASWEIQKWGGYAPITLHLAPYLGLPTWPAMEFPKKYKADVAICPTHQRLGTTGTYHYARHADPSKSPFGGESAAGFPAAPPLRTVTAPEILGKKNSEIMALRDRPLANPQTVHHGGQNVLFLDGHVRWIKGRAEPP